MARASIVALTSATLASPVYAAPVVRVDVDPSSTCTETDSIASRLAARGIFVEDGAPVSVTVRAVTSDDGATASFVLRRGDQISNRDLTASSCSEALDALAFALSLSLEAPSSAPPPVAPPPVTSPPLVIVPAPPQPPPDVATTPSSSSYSLRPLRYGGAAMFGLVAGTSPTVASALVLRADIESDAPRFFAPALGIGAELVLPTSTTRAGADVAFALQTGLLDGCPVRLGTTWSVRPCVELQLGRRQSRAALVPNAQLASSTWAALALALRGRVRIGANVSAELDVVGGSPLIQDQLSVGNSLVYAASPFFLSATFGVGVHFP